MTSVKNQANEIREEMKPLTDNDDQELSINALKRDEKGRLVKGTPPGPGRPKGTISPITRVKQIFEESPDTFEDFINHYMKDPMNRKHIVEMIDGKPVQDLTSKGEKINPVPIISLPNVPRDDSNQETEDAIEEN